jgi:hypothetical protein
LMLMTLKAVEHCNPVSGAGAATAVAPTPPAAAAARAGTGPLQPASSEARSSRAAGPYKPPKIAQPAAAVVYWPRARRTNIVKIH